MRIVQFFILCIFLFTGCRALACIKCHTDYPAIDRQKRLTQTIFIFSDSSLYSGISVKTYRYYGMDSICVLYHSCKKVRIKEGVNRVKVAFSNQDSIIEFCKPYYEVLQRCGNVAPGIYRTFITVTDTLGRNLYSSITYQKVDSTLSSNSFLREDITHAVANSKRRTVSDKRLEKIKGYSSKNALDNSDKRIARLAKKKGLIYTKAEKNGKSYLLFYYDGWFAGQYVVEQQKPLNQQLIHEQDIESAGNMNALAVNDIDLHPSLFSQYKTFKKQRDDKQEVKGDLAITSYAANAQEPNSGIDNNYIEVRGRMEFPLGNLPLEIEGLYTSQDANRKIKSSYLHVHYDVEKIKAETMQFISSYNQKYAETKSKAIGMQQIYTSAISNLEAQKQRLQQEVQQQKIEDDALAPNDQLAVDTPGNVVAENEQKISDAKAKALNKKEELQQKEKQIAALSDKIDHYQKLLEQNKNTNYFDSALAYGKTSQLQQGNISYKQMVKKSADLLPDGTTKKLITGLSNFDAGMFPKYASKYTMGGQMMKGLDLGYDLGFCDLGITVGKTEYIGRDGNLDKYTCYSTRTSFSLSEEHKLAFVYYGYSPDRKLYQGDGLFSNVAIATPTFFQPVHILSVNYSGQLSKYVLVNTETAASFKDKQTSIDISDKGSVHIDAEGNIPWSSMQVSLSYDKTGSNFENSTLPVLLKGTQQYKASTSITVWHGFATLGVDYNYLLQDNLNYSSNNTKWGFSIKTHSKQYPSLSLSYKPYSTFRSFTDTFNIPQRPLFGSVFSGKINYQFKRRDYSMRFSLLYNSSKTISDTMAYGNRLLQAMATYTQKIVSITAMTGYTEQHGSALNTTVPTSMEFNNLTVAYACNKVMSMNAGMETGFTSFGLCRFTMTGGFVLTPKNKPFITRFNLRGGTYKLRKEDKWSPLYGGNLEVDYRFKSRINKRERY